MAKQLKVVDGKIINTSINVVKKQLWPLHEKVNPVLRNTTKLGENMTSSREEDEEDVVKKTT